MIMFSGLGYTVIFISFLCHFGCLETLLIAGILIVKLIISAKWTQWMAETMCSLNVRLPMCAQQTGQSDQFKTVKATDFDVHISRDSLDMNP